MRLLTIFVILAVSAFAQGPINPPNADQADAPGRAARLSVVDGTVSFQPGSVDDWVAATPNRPLTTGDRLWTDADGRAEIDLGSAAMRLSSKTNFSFINLDDSNIQMQLSLGTMSVHVRRLAENEAIEVDTPQVALTLQRPGEYRIEVNEQGDTSIITVRSGLAEANAGQAYTIQPRTQVRVVNAGENAAPTMDTRDAPPTDPFDNWCQSRDREADLSQSGKYVSRDTPGYADLDRAGTWRNDPNYGNVWYPANMPGDWAPYHTGHWAYIAPWGWTWVDEAPWGYAPYHYGRWVFVGGGWGWVPGPVVVAARPVYAPALVGWIGGPGFAVGIGWFPLGPREVFVPGYRYSRAYIERVNGPGVNVAVVNVTYVNRGVVGAVTVVPNGAFVAGRPVAAVAVHVGPEVIARGAVVTRVAVVPERGAILGGRAVVAVRPPVAVVNRAVVTRMAPPAGVRVNARPVVAHSAPTVVARPAPAPVARPAAPNLVRPAAPEARPEAKPEPKSEARPENRKEPAKKAADKKRAEKGKRERHEALSLWRGLSSLLRRGQWSGSRFVFWRLALHAVAPP